MRALDGNSGGRDSGPGAAGTGAGYVAIWAFSALMSLGTLALIRGLRLAFPLSLAAGLALASVNAGVVLLYFMHLRREAKVFWIAAAYSVLSLLFFFFGVFPDIVSAAK
jgi:caa(3)-type oxidase subunit IV